MHEYLLWHQLKKHIKYGDLQTITEADYGQDADAHYAALKGIYDSDHIPAPLHWEPLEVLSLTRWSRYPEQDTHQIEIVLFCSVLLLATYEHQASRDRINGHPENLIIALDCAHRLEEDWLRLYFDFLTQLISKLQPSWVSEEFLYFQLARYIAATLLQRPETAQLLEAVVTAELTHIHHTGEGPFASLMDYTYFTQRRELWAQYLAPVQDTLHQARRYKVLGEPN